MFAIKIHTRDVMWSSGQPLTVVTTVHLSPDTSRLLTGTVDVYMYTIIDQIQLEFSSIEMYFHHTKTFKHII